MGRRVSAEELLAQAEANGYKKGVHKQRDQVKHPEEHVKKTVRDLNATLQRYVLWHLAEMQRDAAERNLEAPREETARERCLHPGIEAPDLAPVKDFLSFYVATSRLLLANTPVSLKW